MKNNDGPSSYLILLGLCALFACGAWLHSLDSLIPLLIVAWRGLHAVLTIGLIIIGLILAVGPVIVIGLATIGLFQGFYLAGKNLARFYVKAHRDLP